MSDGYTDMEGRGWRPWLIAQDVELLGFMGGKFIVEDVREDGSTTTYSLVRADPPVEPVLSETP